MSRGKTIVVFIMLGLLATVLVSGIGFAQDQVQIARPFDGATVRETVNVLIPVSSIPVDGFISAYIDDRFCGGASSKSEDGQHYVYRWDTKVPLRGMDDSDIQQPRDGKHTIAVRAHDSMGMEIGKEKQIIVYVKNNASADMPAGGIKLRYDHRVGATNNYRFKYTMDLKEVGGAKSFTAATGEAIEGAEGTIRRSIEDIMPDDSALVRQKLTSTLMAYQRGQAVPASWVMPKSAYNVEDSTGHITYMMSSSSTGSPIAIDLPNLPTQKVRIGDTWSQADKVFRDVISGNGATLVATSTLEGLEWEGGYPCAKIKTTFSGRARIPFSQIITQPVSISGEMTIYFAYQLGKVVSATTEAIAQADVPQSVVSQLNQSATAQMGPSGNSVFGTGGIDPELAGNTMPGIPSGLGVTGATDQGQTVNVKLAIKQRLELAR